MVASIFDAHKVRDVLFFVEETGGASYLLGNKDFHDRIEANKFPDGSRVAKIQLAEKCEVITKKELKKVNGDDMPQVKAPTPEPPMTTKDLLG